MPCSSGGQKHFPHPQLVLQVIRVSPCQCNVATERPHERRRQQLPTAPAPGWFLAAWHSHPPKESSFQHFTSFPGKTPTSGRRAASTNLHRKAITAAAKMATNSTRSNLGEEHFYLPSGQTRKICQFRENLKCQSSRIVDINVMAIANHVIKSFELCIISKLKTKILIFKSILSSSLACWRYPNLASGHCSNIHSSHFQEWICDPSLSLCHLTREFFRSKLSLES